MVARLLMIGSVLFLAALPQGIILCQGDDGHLRLEIPGLPCCGTDSSDCGDCADRGKPDACEVSAEAPALHLEVARLPADSFADSRRTSDVTVRLGDRAIKMSHGVDLGKTVVLQV